MLSATQSKIINVGLYQLGWFSCILGGAWGHPFIGSFLALFLIAIHLMLAETRKTELMTILCACLLGIVIDSSQQALGVFSLQTDPAWQFWLPLWILVIWSQFATTLSFSLYWLSGRYLLAALFGMLGGPLAYWGGVRLGAAEFGANTLFSIITLSLVWTLVTPLLFWISARLNSQEGRYRNIFGRVI